MILMEKTKRLAEQEKVHFLLAYEGVDWQNRKQNVDQSSHFLLQHLKTEFEEWDMTRVRNSDTNGVTEQLQRWKLDYDR